MAGCRSKPAAGKEHGVVAQLETEYLVIGAGAAGSVLGYLLRQENRDVLMLELYDARKKDKLCGGILSDSGVLHIEEVYGKGSLAELAPFRPRRFVHRAFDKEYEVELELVTMPRKRLDDWLLARYLEKGGTILDRVRLDAVDIDSRVATATDLRTRDTLRIAFGEIIGADGAASGLRRILCGRNQRVVASIEGRAAPVSDDIVFHYNVGYAGYCWHIPTGEGALVGCGAYGATASECRAWLAKFCTELGIEPTGLRGAPIPTGDDIVLAPANGAWLVGDAAGLILPRNSGGLHLALGSARRLASSLLGGPAYEEAMRPLAESIGHDANRVDRHYFEVILAIVKLGDSIA